jgi:hypothetical protein
MEDKFFYVFKSDLGTKESKIRNLNKELSSALYYKLSDLILGTIFQSVEIALTFEEDVVNDLELCTF